MKFTIFLVPFFLCASVIQASEPAVWSVNSRADFLKGDSRGVSIDAGGAISLAPSFNEIYKTGQSFVWSSVIDSNGNVFLGTGSDGRIYKVSPNGAGALFSDLAELNVSALAIGKNGELFAATAPDGKVYKIDSAGKPEVYFDPKEKYIWSLAVMSDGGLAVGTGESGKIFVVREAIASPESSLLFDTSETHIITLQTDAVGNLYVGTDSSGMVLRFGPDRKPFALLDSPLREIHEIAIGPDGSVYALALGESIAASGTTPQPTPEAKPIAVAGRNPLAPPQPEKSRYDLTGAKSAVYRILPNGGTEVIWSSTSVTAFSIYAHQTGNGVLIGTSDKGRIYSIRNDGGETLVVQSDAGQISAIRASGPNLYAAASNQGVLYRIGASPVREGIYESMVFDAGSSADWGRLWWRSAGNVRIETRSGNTESPNETWTGWNAVQGTAQSGRVASPRARYLQWRAILRPEAAGNMAAADSARLFEANLAFLSQNIAPEVLSISTLPPNVGLLSNPPMQIDPNIELSGIDPQIFGIPPAQIPPRRAYLRGARAFQWNAEDRNGDKLLFDVFYMETGEAAYKMLRENISENFISIDGLSLADGRYTLKVVAKDSPTNPAGQFLVGERISEPFDIDNSAPVVSVVGQPRISGARARIEFTAADKSSYIVRAEYSVNGGDWRAVYAEDGISDGPDERFVVEIPVRPSGEYSVTLRVFDLGGNVGNARAIIRR